jgi:hypothetical protein
MPAPFACPFPPPSPTCFPEHGVERKKSPSTKKNTPKLKEIGIRLDDGHSITSFANTGAF